LRYEDNERDEVRRGRRDREDRRRKEEKENRLTLHVYIPPFHSAYNNFP
jgi:hypothetical protein